MIEHERTCYRYVNVQSYELLHIQRIVNCEDVTRVLRGCHEGVTRVLKECYMDVTQSNKSFCDGVKRAVQGFYKLLHIQRIVNCNDVTRVLQEC
jgi:hypothetical protein